MYKKVARPILFSLDPEFAHHLTMLIGRGALKCGLLPLIKKRYELEDSRLEQNLFGIRFKNPVGLAAGSDKNCEAQEFLSCLGFGFLEGVSFAYREQPGNPKPRLFRLLKDEALINRLGFPSIGAEKLAPRVKTARQFLSNNGVVMGVNFAKSKEVPLEEAVGDYLKSFRIMKELADYIVINVSSPNTPGLRNLQEKKRLNEILSALQIENTVKVPLLVKVAPDLTFEELDDVVECALENNLQGIVATNTTKSREKLSSPSSEEGGLSGKPLFKKSISFVRRLRKILQGRLKIIGVGGISGPENAIEMIKAGADLIEFYTGLVYEGPVLPYKIKQGLIEYMDKNRLTNISELVGSKS